MEEPCYRPFDPCLSNGNFDSFEGSMPQVFRENIPADGIP